MTRLKLIAIASLVALALIVPSLDACGRRGRCTISIAAATPACQDEAPAARAKCSNPDCECGPNCKCVDCCCDPQTGKAMVTPETTWRLLPRSTRAARVREVHWYRWTTPPDDRAVRDAVLTPRRRATIEILVTRPHDETSQ